jgi:Domain of unknown function (DUF6894)
MPRYFFHVRVRDELIIDREGLELPSFEFARDECYKAIREIMSEEKWLEDFVDCEFHIVDELGRTLAVIPFDS